MRVIRGTEARAIAKRQKDGWELVSQSQGKLRSEMTFRRPKPKPPWRVLGIVGGAAVLLAGVIVLGVSLSGDEDSAPAAAPTGEVAAPSEELSEELAAEPEPTEQAEQETLTAENNPDLAALLMGPDGGAAVEAFATTYAGRLIEYDGNVGAMAPHGDTQTRFDMLILAGDFSETQMSGPYFQYRDVNTTYDLHYVGDNVQDGIGVGDNLHVVARVGDFNPDSSLFQLEPISTQFR